MRNTSDFLAFTHEDLVGICAEKFVKRLHATSIRSSAERPRALTAEGAAKLSYRTTAIKKSPRELLERIQLSYKNKRIRLLFRDEPRIGQKEWTCHIWWRRAERRVLCGKASHSPGSSRRSSPAPTTASRSSCRMRIPSDASVPPPFLDTGLEGEPASQAASPECLDELVHRGRAWAAKPWKRRTCRR